MSYEKALEAAEFIRKQYDKEIKVAIVLGSGLGAFADDLENAVKIRYEEIPHFANHPQTRLNRCPKRWQLLFLYRILSG